MIANRTGMGFVALLAACLIQSCDFPHACALNAEPAIVVTVLDASTGAPLAQDAVGLLRLHGVVDTLVPHGYDPDGNLSTLASSGISGGFYDVLVMVPGYDTWTDKALVQRGQCGFAMQTFTARLERTSAP